MLALLLGVLICPAQDISGRVVKITDGDTLTIAVVKHSLTTGPTGKESLTVQVKVRLEGIDAPESKQPFGSKSKDFLGSFCFGKDAQVNTTGKDRYGRTLGEVFVDGKSANKALLSAGLAWHYKEYSKDQELSRLEREARLAGVGLWSQANPIPPWDWRKTERQRRLNKRYAR